MLKGDNMVEQLHRFGVELFRVIGSVLTDLILSFLLLGVAATLVSGSYNLLIAYISPAGMLVGFVCVVPISYIFVRLTQEEK